MNRFHIRLRNASNSEVERGPVLLLPAPPLPCDAAGGRYRAAHAQADQVTIVPVEVDDRLVFTSGLPTPSSGNFVFSSYFLQQEVCRAYSISPHFAAR
jgi:hypothetical protein